MSAYFVAGTGTDVGKTFVTVALIHALRKRSHEIAALKPVASGFDQANIAHSDSGQLLAALGRPIDLSEIERITPWCFSAPLSPDMAAQREGRVVDFRALVSFSKHAAAAHSTVLIEGIGGVMTPLDGQRTVVDWIGASEMPVILVAGSYLGSLSHTLTALEVLAQRRIAVAAIVVNETAGSLVSLPETAATIARLATHLKVICVPRMAVTAIEPPGIGDLAALTVLAP